LKGNFGKETGFLFLILLPLLVLVISELVERGEKKRGLQNTGVLVLDRNLNKRKASKLLNESQGPTIINLEPVTKQLSGGSL
jgi:hypothetical protein